MKHIKSFIQLNESESEMEIAYVEDINHNIKNISKNPDDAYTFLEKALKNVGDVFIISVPVADWNAEKVTATYIKALVHKSKYGLPQ